MDQVVIGIGSPTAIFHSISRSASDDVYAGGSFVVEVRSDGFRVEREVFMFSFDWDNLAAFFSDLAESWQGWEGEKSWESIEHDLTIVATADPGRHSNLEFTVQDGPNYTWQAKVGGFVVDAGEDMSTLARSVKDWAQGRSG
jgi:hypothetical protein